MVSFVCVEESDESLAEASLLHLADAAWLRGEADHRLTAATGEHLAIDLLRTADGFVVIGTRSRSAMSSALESHAYFVFHLRLAHRKIN